MNFGYLSTFQALDKGFIECLGPTGFVASTSEISSNFSAYNNGFLYTTISVFVIGLVAFLTFFAFSYVGFVNNISFAFFSLVGSYFLFNLLNTQ